MIDSKLHYSKKSITVKDRKMAFIEIGTGDPIVFIHGNANSSYMWRNILPYMEDLGRLIAIDNIGQGDSDKLPESGPGSYTLAEHQIYINGIMDALNINKNVTLVMHDWGGPLGLTWARSNSQYIKGLVHCEIVVGNHSSYDEYPDSHGERLKRVRGQDGEELVMTDNYFIEKIFTGGVIRNIDDETMAEIRRPYEGSRENRRPTLTWPRQIPIEGKPKDVADLVNKLSLWMTENNIPKLFIRAEPGQILFGRDLEIIDSWTNQKTVTVHGLHHPQEDSPDDIGVALRDWYKSIS
ncbi:MAG: haloalkane dehalogenase [Rhodospirillaceae bacterium]|nr:haloalkane dehalogenase [Rhodospirillaceae bacterium]MBC94143.1 haloalkane dehalogenase [Rhodospirillaceae bacterium]|tara:strand:+ start:9799 stop:10683 length:885 start_codon:yes stop_codon:yes gene_type:complete